MNVEFYNFRNAFRRIIPLDLMWRKFSCFYKEMFSNYNINTKQTN